jgi:hypothetical protein
MSSSNARKNSRIAKEEEQPRAQSYSQSRSERSGCFALSLCALPRASSNTSLYITSDTSTKRISLSNRQHLPKYHHNLTNQQSCLANPAVPPLRPSAPPSLLLSLALRPSSPPRLARPAPLPLLLPTSTLLLPLLNKLRPQRAAVAVSSAKWPALLRKFATSIAKANTRSSLANTII